MSAVPMLPQRAPGFGAGGFRPSLAPAAAPRHTSPPRAAPTPHCTGSDGGNAVHVWLMPNLPSTQTGRMEMPSGAVAAQHCRRGRRKEQPHGSDKIDGLVAIKKKISRWRLSY